MSVSAVIERIKKLEANGIIKQYTVVLDSKKLGMDITAFISVSMEHPKYNNNFNEFVKTHKQITECHYITGDFDFLLKVNTESTGGLESLLNEIKSAGGVSLTKTLVVLSTVKEDYSVNLEINIVNNKRPALYSLYRKQVLFLYNQAASSGTALS